MSSYCRLLLIGLFVVACLGGEASKNVFSVFTGYYPSSWTDLGPIPSGTIIKATLQATLPNQNIRFTLRSGPTIRQSTAVTTSSQANPTTHTLQTTLSPTQPQPQNYWIQILTADNHYIECILKVQIDGQTTVYNKQTMFYNTALPVHKIVVDGKCKLKLRHQGKELKMMRVYDEKGVKIRRNPIVTIRTSQEIINIPKKGNYYLIIQQRFPDFPEPYSVEVTTYYGEDNKDTMGNHVGMSPLDKIVEEKGKNIPEVEQE